MSSRLKRLLRNDSSHLYSSPLCGIVSNYIKLDKVLHQAVRHYLLPPLTEVVLSYSIPNVYRNVKFLSSEEKFVEEKGFSSDEDWEDLVYFQLTHYANGFSKIKIRNTLPIEDFTDPDPWPMDIFPQKVLYLCYTNLVKTLLIFLSTDETNIGIWCNTESSAALTYKHKIFKFLRKVSKYTNSHPFDKEPRYKCEKLNFPHWARHADSVIQTFIDVSFDIVIPASNESQATIAKFQVEALHVSSPDDPDYMFRFLYYTVYFNIGNGTGRMSRNVIANNHATRSILYELCKTDELLSTELKLSISPFIYRIELMQLIEELWD